MMLKVTPRSLGARSAFTIVELLAATAVFIGLLLMLVTATNQTGEIWRRSSSKVEQFQQARRGFESMTRRISQATLNTYWDYDFPLDAQGNPDRTQLPKGYVRQSELRFRSGEMANLMGPSDGILRPTHGIFFQAPLGFVDTDVAETFDARKNHRPLHSLLNTWGFFLEVEDDSRFIPDFLTGRIPVRVRSRLMELMEPSASLKMDNPSQIVEYSGPNKETKTIKTADPNWDDPRYIDWFALPIKKRSPVRVLSENVIALVILPRLSAQDEQARRNAGKTDLLCPLYDYDSKRYSNKRGAATSPTEKAADSDLNPKNQLPPVVLVTMIALDETSAQRLDTMSGGDRRFGLDLDSLFKQASKLETAETGDLAMIERRLIEKRLTYRIFSSNVAIRGAKWSRGQN